MLEEIGLPIQKMILIEVSSDDLKERVLGRRIHKASGRSYHVKFKPPKQEGADDLTGELLETRADDTEEALEKRLVSYQNQTLPVVDHYSEKVLRVRSSNDNPPSAVLEATLKMLRYL
eukprot:TRINITY_DN4816_c0_g1_i3.p1 TRINITY_DN4816_c0_g1~~TRINITY_DN4816_c0_g1_i3.p1  ORF type:complete len:118 (+),score=37.98 TRINITY_DN4816_c0_g1_i3:179-532(+)